MDRAETRRKIIATFREHFQAMRVHCPYPTINFALNWVDCGGLASIEVDHEFYCKKHAEALLNAK
jgi:hypothetical protein